MVILKAPIAKESRFLVYALIFTILCHGAAMLAMLAFLLPGMPGGNADLAHRVSYISDHALFWKIGWLPWQLTALSDLILAIALVKTSWIPRVSAVVSLVFTLLAIAAEQPAEYRWTTEGISLAQRGDLAAYQVFENQVFALTSHWAAFLYTVAAIFWSICLARGKAWSRGMTCLSVVLWGLLIIISVAPLLNERFNPKFVSAGNAAGFFLMMIWFCSTLFLVKKRS